jgi:hypothetical protein
MDSDHFDAWTRRQVGLGFGGAIAGLFGLLAYQDIEAKKKNKKKKRKKKKRRKRCLKLGTLCTTGSTQKCCSGLECDFPSGGFMGTLCCGTEGQECDGAIDCCGGFACSILRGRCEIV